MIPLIICGNVIKKLKMPMYTPIFPAGIDPARMAYGMARILAHAIPIPTMDNISIFGLSMRKMDINPSPPAMSENACVRFLPNHTASDGSNKANNAQKKRKEKIKIFFHTITQSNPQKISPPLKIIGYAPYAAQHLQYNREIS